MVKNLFLIPFVLLLLASCAKLKIFSGNKDKKYQVSLKKYEDNSKEDYLDQIKAYEQFYFNSSENTRAQISHNATKYLVSLTKTIVENNEIFFLDKTEPTIKIIQNEQPFHFSLPGKKIFISTGLLKKYVRSEKLLYCLLVFELIRSEKNLYKRELIIPTGYLSTGRILSLTRLTTEEKVEVHKWAFYLLNRIGLDTDIYLSWIQIQNRNAMDFSMQLGDVASISKEESLFKAFLIKNTDEKLLAKKYSTSSRQFYNFINSIK